MSSPSQAFDASPSLCMDLEAVEEEEEETSEQSSKRQRTSSESSSHSGSSSTHSNSSFSRGKNSLGSATPARSATLLRDVDRLAERIYRKLAPPISKPLPMQHHRAAVSTMVALRDLLQSLTSGGNSNASMAVLCAGVEAFRRVMLTVDDDATVQHLGAPCLSCLSWSSCATDPAPRPTRRVSHAGHDARQRERTRERDGKAHRRGWRGSAFAAPVSPERKVLLGWRARSTWDEMEEGSGKREITPESVCRAALVEARSDGIKWDLDTLHSNARVFFQCSAQTMLHQFLGEGAVQEEERSTGFLTLDTVSFLKDAGVQREERLAAIADVAESEAGQQVLRDLILSFTLPSEVVGMRRTALIGREAQASATQNHTTLSTRRTRRPCVRHLGMGAHGKGAAQGVCLLAGLAIMLASKTQDAIRKEDAFNGRRCSCLYRDQAAQAGRPQDCFDSRATSGSSTLDKTSSPRCSFAGGL